MSYLVHFRPLFLPGMLGNAPYLVRFHGITVTGGDGRGDTHKSPLDEVSNSFLDIICGGNGSVMYSLG